MSDHRNVNPWIVAIAVMFATFMEVLDTTVVNVSLPHIASTMSATTDEATWVLTSYLVANAIILPMTGWLASRFGRKRLLMLSTVGFTIASGLCGLAPNLASLVIFRIIQGLTGGALQPLSQAVLLESFKPEDRGKAMGFWGLGIVVAPILGPVFGGWVTENYDWRWVFYINIPVGAMSIFMIQRYVFDPPYLRRESKGIDYWGMGLLVLGIGALQFVLDKGQTEDWFESNLITTLSVISVVVAGGADLLRAVRHERTDCRSARVQEPHVCDRRVPDDGGRLRPLRQHGVAAGDAADAVRLFVARSGEGDGAARRRVADHDADGRHADDEDRSAKAAGARPDGRRDHDAVARTGQSQREPVGLHAAAVPAGRRHGAAVRAADDGVDGDDQPAADGICHQPVQPDAQHRRRRRHRHDRHLSAAASAGRGRVARRARQRLRSDRRNRRCRRSRRA